MKCTTPTTTPTIPAANLDESGEIYMGAYGYFVPTGAPSNEDADGDGEYVDYEDTGDSDGYYIDDDYHVDISSFEGCWYYDGDLSADRYILIDAYGEWFYYARNEGDAEASEIDCGDLRIAEGETSTYYADSDWYSNVSYRVFEFDTGVLTWDEEGFYRMGEVRGTRFSTGTMSAKNTAFPVKLRLIFHHSRYIIVQNSSRWGLTFRVF